jgi:hypothetical protein
MIYFRKHEKYKNVRMHKNYNIFKFIVLKPILKCQETKSYR